MPSKYETGASAEEAQKLETEQEFAKRVLETTGISFEKMQRELKMIYSEVIFFVDAVTYL